MAKPRETESVLISSPTTVQSMARGNSHKRVPSAYLTVVHLCEGKIEVVGEKATYTVHPGDTVIINAFDSFRFRALSDSVFYHFIFDSPRYFDEIGIPALCRFEECIRGDTLLAELCRRVNDEYENRAAYHEKMLISLTSQLVIYLFRHYSEPQSILTSQLMGKQKIVRTALSYIYDNCQNGISTRDIGAHIGVSTAYLCRCFHDALNTTPLECSERIRCRKASEDLALGIYTVSDVAEKYHYASLSYFIRRYRKYCKCTPAMTLAEAIERRARIEKNPEQAEADIPQAN